MKKITTLLVCICFAALLFLALTAADAPTVSIVCDPSCESGDTITAAVRVSGVTDYAAISMRLAYDNTKMSVLSLEKGSAFSGLWTTNLSFSENEVFLSFTGSSAISTEDVLFTVTFSVANTVEGTAEFSINALKVKDINSAAMDVAAVGTSTEIVYDPVIIRPSLSQESISDGETVTVSIELSKLTGYCAVSCRLEYDPEVFTVQSVTKGSTIPDGLFTVNKTYSENEVYVSFAGADPISVNGVLAEITFTAAEYVNAEADFTVKNIRAKDVESNFIEVAAGKTALAVVCRHADVSWVTTEEPACGVFGKKEFVCTCGYTASETLEALEHAYVGTVHPSTDTEAGYIQYVCSLCGDTYTDDTPLLGDMNGDFRINILDVLRALKNLLNDDLTAYPDMNEDGRFSLADILRLMKKVTEA